MPQPLIQETAQLLQHNFELPEITQEISEEQLVNILTPIIHHMLDRDFERLLQVCYRIDLGEKKLQKILHDSTPDQLAKDLAVAIVARQKMKIEIRRRYSE
jgi:vacuolar-type H+-ATPase catalytic subunit A/Vma1